MTKSEKNSPIKAVHASWNAFLSHKTAIISYLELAPNPEPLRPVIDKLRRCCKHVAFGKWIVDGEKRQRIDAQRMFWCGQTTICPTCQAKDQRQRVAKFSAALDIIEHDPLWQGKAAFAFVTLTIRAARPSNLADTVDRLRTGYNALRQLPGFPAKGDAYRIEVPAKWRDCNTEKYAANCSKKGKLIPPSPEDLMFQPHIHALWICPPGAKAGKNYVSNKKLRAMWQAALGTDFAFETTIRWLSAKREAIRAFGYATKPDATPDDARVFSTEAILAAYDCLKGVRRFQAYGVLRAALAKVKPLGELVVLTNLIDYAAAAPPEEACVQPSPIVVKALRERLGSTALLVDEIPFGPQGRRIGTEVARWSHSAGKLEWVTNTS